MDGENKSVRTQNSADPFDAAEKEDSVRGLLIPLQGMSLLVPNTVVAEVVDSGETLKAVPGAPLWLLGSMNWRALSVPVISFERLVNQPATWDGRRLAVFNTLNSNRALPFVGLAVHGIPRLVRVSSASTTVQEGTTSSSFQLCQVRVDGTAAVIPDLDAIEKTLGVLPFLVG